MSELTKKTLFFTLLTVFSLITFARAASLGNQRLNFIAKGQNVYWITEDIGGQYETSMLLQLVLEDGSASLGKTEISEYRRWEWLEESAEQLRSERAVELKPDQNGKLSASGLDFAISPPAANEKLMEQFSQHIHDGGSNGQTFNSTFAKAGVDVPVLAEARAELLYYYPAGLYVNYDIEKAYWLGRSGQLLVFTHQPAKAVGLDTMHGFMLLQVREK